MVRGKSQYNEDASAALINLVKNTLKKSITPITQHMDPNADKLRGIP